MPPSAWAASSWVTPLLFPHVMPTQTIQRCLVRCPLVISSWKSVGIISLTTRLEQITHTSHPPAFISLVMALPSTQLPRARC